MLMVSKLLKDVLRLVENVAAAQDVGVYYVEMAGRTLRVMVEIPGGTTLDKCSRFSRALSDELDRREVFADRYILEVSSPGVERSLYQPRHFQEAVGRCVFVRTNQETHEGILRSADENAITLAYKENGKRTEARIRYTSIKVARTKITDLALFAARKPVEVEQ